MPEKYQLIIAEKPNAALKVAEALADKKVNKKSIGKVSYYEIEHNGKKIIVACAVGHLFNLAEKDKKKGWSYPIFSYEWKPSYEVSKSALFTKAYVDVIKKLAKDADDVINACDFDIEGSTIGFNVIRFICGKKDGKRMKYSTLTKDELVSSYENAMPHLDFSQIESGVTRHSLDWLWGLNLSRALTLSVKSSLGMFKLLSTGRVQGPTLKILYEREKEIAAFKPVPFWEIELLGETKKKEEISAWYKEDKFWEKEKAEKVLKNCKGKKALVSGVDLKEFKQKSPTPFDLTSLQMEAYAVLGISPQRTLELAQDLYSNGFISYPRTSSQKLPESIGYKKILKSLSKAFPKETSFLLSKDKLVPNNGKKEDAAHPAIYPTGDLPGKLEDKAAGLYELITRRFFATFGDDAIRETLTIEIDVNKELFIAKGTRTKEKGWHELYGRFVKLEDEELPALVVGDEIKVVEIKLYDKETKPPSRYNEASIIKEMEKNNIGTKCITEDTLVNYSNGIFSLADDFLNYKGLNFDDAEIVLNNDRKVFGFFNGRLIKSNYLLSSRRKLEDNEKVHKISFMDGTSIKLTSEHPILTFINEDSVYKKVADIKNGDKIVSVAYIQRDSNELLRDYYSFFNNLKFSKLYCYFNLKGYRIDNVISQQNLGKKLGVGQATIFIWEREGHIPLIYTKYFNFYPNEFHTQHKNQITNPFPIYWSSSLAALLGNLLGDGSLDKEKLRRENCFDFRYSNTDLVLIRRFTERIFEIFGVSLIFKKDKRIIKNHKPKYYVQLPSIIGRILAVLFPELKTKDCPQISKEFGTHFIGALFDDEGHVNKKEAKLFISNTHLDLLNGCKIILNDLGIKTCLEANAFKLHIYGKYNILKFLSFIPINSIRKKQDLIDLLSVHYNYGCGSLLKLEKAILLSLLQQELTIKELASALNGKPVNIKTTIVTLNKNFGVIEKKIYGVSSGSHKIVKYFLKDKNIIKLYSLINENIINEDFITKTVCSNELIPYEGYVYDITNNEDMPNFVLENGVVIHNSTRAGIVQNLYDRNYISDKPIVATNLGMKTVEALDKYCPEILDVGLTRKFEEDMESIEEGKVKGDKIIDDAKVFLTKALGNFKKKEKEIGKELGQAAIETRDKEAFVGKCPVCKEGNLQMRRGKFGLFAACDRYEQGCKTTFTLPKNGLVKGAEKECTVCGYPMVLVFRAKRKPQELCINPQCPSKKEAEERLRKLVEGKKCPNCGSQLVIKNGFYGPFLACPGYPKCKHIEKMPKE